MITAKLIWELQATIIDFGMKLQLLQYYLKVEICMTIPQGKEYMDNEYLLLKKTIYGLIQIVREFYK